MKSYGIIIEMRNGLFGLSGRARVLLLLGCICAMVSSAHAGCTLAPAPSRIPDGTTASDEEMQAIMTTMSHYETDVNNYIKCVTFEASQGRLSAQDQARLTNEALERHQATVMRFNAQMRVYMAR